MSLGYWIYDLLSDCCHEEYKSKQEAEGAKDDVAGGEECIIPAQGICCRHYEELGSVELAHIKLIINIDSVVSFLETIFNCTIYFLELRQASSSHPDHESFCGNKKKNGVRD